MPKNKQQESLKNQSKSDKTRDAGKVKAAAVPRSAQSETQAKR